MRIPFIAPLICAIWIVLGAAAGPQPAPPPHDFIGGPYDGMRFTHEVRKDRSFRTKLFPSPEGASPLDGDKAATVAAFLEAYHAQDWPALLRLIAPGAKSWIVERNPFPDVGGPYTDSDQAMPSFDRFPFVERCVSRAPYGMRDGSVRLEWMCDGELWYVSWLKVSAGRVTWMETRRARAPLVVDAEMLRASAKSVAPAAVDR